MKKILKAALDPKAGNVIKIIGGGLADDIYEMEVDGKTIMWNVSKMRRAAKLGMFGAPVGIYMSDVPMPPNYDNLDRKKIDAIKKDRDLLDEPLICIGADESAHGYSILCIADGNHRLTALYELKAKGFFTYIVPPKLEKAFRMEIIVQEGLTPKKRRD